jgi:hypothetical protein
MKIKQYRVTAGKVTVETAVGPGRAQVDFFKGDVLPNDVPQAQIETELGLHTIVEVVRAEPAVGGSAGDSGAGDDQEGAGTLSVPGGMSVSTTLEWVDSDPLKAQAALNAEEASASPRSTLVARLEAVITAAEEAAANADPGSGPSVDS